MAMCAIITSRSWGETIRPDPVSDGSLYYKPLPHSGTAKSFVGTVKGKAYELTVSGPTLVGPM